MVRGLPATWGICSRTVSLRSSVLSISHWNKNLAVGSGYGDIIILDTVTGSQTAVLSGHTDEINSVTFSSDGKLLASGSDDKTVKLWDVQTGGVIKTFFGHTSLVRSVSISADCAIIASGSWDNVVRLWDIETGECRCIIEQEGHVFLVTFSPTNPHLLLSVSNGTVQQWDTDGNQAGPAFAAAYADFSSDGTQILSYCWTTATIRSSISGEVLATFETIHDEYQYCCFSPDGRLVAITAGSIAYVWSITGPEPYLIETFVGHSGFIASMVFSSPSSLISASGDHSVRFWKIVTPSQDPVGTNVDSTSFTSAIIRSITLQAKDGITITSDSDGVIKTWDILTGLSKALFQTPAKGFDKRDVRLINGSLVLAWHTAGEIRIWDVEKEELLLTASGPQDVENLRISADGSQVFSLKAGMVQAQSLETGDILGKVEVKYPPHISGSLTVDGSRVWVHYPNLEDQVWGFEAPGSPPTQLSNIPLDKLHPNGNILWDSSQSCIREKATRKVVFCLSKRYGKPADVQWNDQYLVACFISGEIFVLGFNHVL